MIRCVKCSGFVTHRVNYSDEGMFSEWYCINCGFRLERGDPEASIYRRKMSRRLFISVKTAHSRQISIESPERLSAV